MRRWRRQTMALCAVLAPAPALGQTPPAPAAPTGQVMPGVTVTATQLDDARNSIQPGLGASRFDFTPGVIDTVPQGSQAPINSVLLRAPGVAQDSFGQLHVRGDHGNLQYRLDGVQLPEGLSLFNNALATQYARKMSLVTGALPAQYGFRTAGVVDIALKSGTTDPGAEASMTLGTYDWRQPSFSYGGQSGKIDYFVTGQFRHNAIGIENPTSSASPIHDDTDQWHGLGKVTGIIDEQTRVSFIAGGSKARFQIPNNPNQTPAFTVAGASELNSALLNQRQFESNYFGILSLQKHTEALDWQLSGFARHSNLTYKPDPFGDLMFNGIAPWARRTNFATGMQGDGSWKAAANHTVRGGFLVQRERSTDRSDAQVLPVDDTGAPTQDQAIGITTGADNIGWMYGFYLQDEWKILPKVTVNYGLRFDQYDGIVSENQVSPRINVVWQANDWLTVHAGYSRYFTPPPLAQVNNGAIAATLGTTAAPALTQNDPVRAERAHYFDAGFEVQPLDGLKLGVDAYYKSATNLLDEGQFGAPIILTSFNYASAIVKGVELSASYDTGPWSLFGNLAWSEAQGTSINSAQFNFAPDELAFIQNDWIYLDHNQSWTASGGAAYTFNYGSDWATRLSADLIYGNGLRKTVVTPNDQANPAYAVLNLSAAQKIPVKGTAGTTLRLDLLNVFDASYQLRDGSGVGVGAPQFGLRRTFLVSLTQKF
jgi:outer membrane receptor protein involved in Fe transport